MSNEQHLYPDNLGTTNLSDSTSDISKQNLLCQLNHLEVIEVHGDDAESFLHGQLTNNVTALGENTLQVNGYCDPKGRLLALFLLIRLADKYLIIIDQSISANVIKRLKMFVLMAAVKFAATAQKCIGFDNDDSQKTPALLSNEKLSPKAVCLTSSGLIAARLENETARYILIGDNAQLSSAWNTLSKSSLPCDSSVWHLLNIRAGQPNVVEKTQGLFVPQMMNLELVNGLSFNKGCYPGQEVVARMHHLGKLKRRMYRLHIHCKKQPLPGDGIYSPKMDSNARQGHVESVGKVVSAAQVDANEFEALAILQIKHNDDNDLYLGDGDDTTIEILDLPYEIE